jgi:hypothetical protein
MTTIQIDIGAASSRKCVGLADGKWAGCRFHPMHHAHNERARCPLEFSYTICKTDWSLWRYRYYRFPACKKAEVSPEAGKQLDHQKENQ